MNPTRKRGRKRTTNLYFGPDQEKAVVDFLQSTDDEMKEIKFLTHFYAPHLNKMIESIIRRYKLYRKDITFEDIHSDTLSFLATKMEKFEPSKNKKAYSYFGTICKNYLLGQLLKADKRMKSDLSYEDVYKL